MKLFTPFGTVYVNRPHDIFHIKGAFYRWLPNNTRRADSSFFAIYSDTGMTSVGNQVVPAGNFALLPFLYA